MWHNVKFEVGIGSVIVVVDGMRVLEWRGTIVDRRYAGIGFAAANGGMDNWHIVDDVHINLSRSLPRFALPSR